MKNLLVGIIFLILCSSSNVLGSNEFIKNYNIVKDLGKTINEKENYQKEQFQRYLNETIDANNNNRKTRELKHQEVLNKLNKQLIRNFSMLPKESISNINDMLFKVLYGQDLFRLSWALTNNKRNEKGPFQNNDYYIDTTFTDAYSQSKTLDDSLNDFEKFDNDLLMVFKNLMNANEHLLQSTEYFYEYNISMSNSKFAKSQEYFRKALNQLIDYSNKHKLQLYWPQYVIYPKPQGLSKSIGFMFFESSEKIVVLSIDPNSTNKELKIGDTILGYEKEGNKILFNNHGEYYNWLSSEQIGNDIKLLVLRDGREETINVKIR